MIYQKNSLLLVALSWRGLVPNDGSLKMTKVCSNKSR